MEKPLSDLQQTLLRSIISNLFQQDKQPFSLSIECSGGRSPVLNAALESENMKYLCEFPQEKKSKHLSKEELIERLVDSLRHEENTLVVDRGAAVERIQFQQGKLQRSSEKKVEQNLAHPLWAIGKATHLDPAHSAPLLKTIGLMTEQGEIKAPMRKKFKQVNHFLDLLIPILKNSTGKPFTLLDCGCGQSYLGFVLFWYLRKVLQCKANFVGVDETEKLIQNCRKQANALGLSEMKFQCSSILEAELPERMDLLVSLHACDTATDEAIAQGIANEARNIVVVPCCQQEIARQLDGVPYYPIKKHGIFTQRFGDLLTDMARSLYLEGNGYTVTAGEFVSTEDTPKNLMLRATQGNPKQEQRLEEYHEFCLRYNIFPSVEYYTQGLEARTIRP